MLVASQNHRVSFLTLGCKVNQYETQQIRDGFLSQGFSEVAFDAASDVVVINTCTVTGVSDKKSRQTIRGAMRRNPAARVLVTGCMADTDFERLEDLVGVGRVFRHADKDRLVQLFLEEEGFDAEVATPAGVRSFEGRHRVFVKIQDGCDLKCTYCIIPFVRGASRSRALNEIVTEIRGIHESGHHEVVLTGIHIGLFGHDLSPRLELADLVEEILARTELPRLRISSLDSNEVTPRLIDLLGREPRLCGHLHLPLQSGCDATLKRMGRLYRSGDFLDCVEAARAARPDVAITTDLIVGFPGEDDTELAQSLETVERARFQKIHLFPYSVRPGTPAEKLRSRIDPKVIRERKSRIEEIERRDARRFREEHLGQVVTVLVEDRDDRGRWSGLTQNFIKVTFDGPSGLDNTLAPVRLDQLASDFEVEGQLQA
ncbi:MAG: tRNA (N(6)-L-threonylcarbamoyladenosine(37)-C(2))-methylthiotransferase MtaB [Planctomycetota bacterium]